MLSAKKNILALILCFSPFLFYAQVKDKKWLLLDSVNYSTISKENKIILDSILPLYHKAKQDTDKLSLLLTLSEIIEDENLWPRYNRLAYEAACKGGDAIVYLRGKANALNNMGYLAQSNGNIPVAINYYSQALALREKIKDKYGIANSLNNLGYIFDDLRDIEKAQEYYSRALQMREQLGDKQGMVNSMNNLGGLYYFKKNYAKSIYYHEKALKIAKELNYKRGIAYGFNNLGNVYRQQGNLQKALEYQTLGLKIGQEIGDMSGLSGTYSNFAAIYEQMHDLKKAALYAEKGLNIAKEANQPEKIRESSYLLFEIYKEDKHFEQALNMHLLYIKMRDSTNSEVARKASVRQQFKYEYEKKEANLKAEQEKKDVLAAAETHRQKLFLALVTAIALAVAIVAIIVIRSLRITKKQKQIIETQKLMVEEKQKEILDSIRYAKRIQDSLLPSKNYIERNLKRLRGS